MLSHNTSCLAEAANTNFIVWINSTGENKLTITPPMRFQRRRLKCEKLTDDGRQVMAKAHIAFGKVN
jgi:hypothetical protein